MDFRDLDIRNFTSENEHDDDQDDDKDDGPGKNISPLLICCFQRLRHNSRIDQ